MNDPEHSGGGGMSDPAEEVVRDRALEPFVTAPLAGAAAGVFGNGVWVVLTDEQGEAVGAVPPAGDLGAPREDMVGIVTADAGTPVAAAVASAAFQAIDAGTPVVLLDEGRIVGVWAGPDLADALLHGAVRLPGATALPGRIDIPLIRRRCRVCGEQVTFAEKPVDASPCPNSRGLDPHEFGW